VRYFKQIRVSWIHDEVYPECAACIVVYFLRALKTISNLVVGMFVDWVKCFAPFGK